MSGDIFRRSAVSLLSLTILCAAGAGAIAATPDAATTPATAAGGASASSPATSSSSASNSSPGNSSPSNSSASNSAASNLAASATSNGGGRERPPEPPQAYTYICEDGARIIARFPDTELAMLIVGEDRYELKSVPAASGVRYTGGAVEFWTHQGAARFTRAGKETECRQPAPDEAGEKSIPQQPATGGN